MGLGAMAGYTVFHHMFLTRCEELLDTTERSYNESSAELVHRYLQAVDMHTKCMEDKKQQLQLLELKGRLEGQDVLVGRHQQLLDKHHESVERLSYLQSVHEDTLRKFHTLQTNVEAKQQELAELQQSIQDYTESKNQMERKMTDQRHLSTNIVKKKIEENKRLKAEKESCLASQRMIEYDFLEIKQQVQTRQLAASIERYDDVVWKFHC
jgi:chromosome segregation ATPase